MENNSDVLHELVQVRIRELHLTNDLADVTHLFYSTLLCISAQADSDFRRQTLGLIRSKFFQMPQGSRLGQMFIEIDTQFGRPLESNGVNLQRWVFEPRGRWNG